MSEQRKSFMREVIDVLEAGGFEVISIVGPDYEVICDWAKVTVRKLPPDMPEGVDAIMATPPLRSKYK